LRVFVELEGMYRNMVEQLAIYAARNDISSFIRLKALKYYEMRSIYSHLPSHYAYTACRDAAARAESFLKLKEEGRARREVPEVRRITIWLDDQLWKPNGYTSIEIATHRGKVPVEIELHKQYWKYVNRGWKISGEVKIKLYKKAGNSLSTCPLLKTLKSTSLEGTRKYETSMYFPRFFILVSRGCPCSSSRPPPQPLHPFQWLIGSYIDGALQSPLHGIQ